MVLKSQTMKKNQEIALQKNENCFKINKSENVFFYLKMSENCAKSQSDDVSFRPQPKNIQFTSQKNKKKFKYLDLRSCK